MLVYVAISALMTRNASVSCVFVQDQFFCALDRRHALPTFMDYKGVLFLLNDK